MARNALTRGLLTSKFWHAMNFQISKDRCMRLATLGEPYDIAAGGVASNAVFATLHERQGEHYLRFQPNGYEFPISLPVITSGSREQARAWTWNGSLEKPTLKPSVKTTHADGKVSHIWLTDGLCQHLDDSTDGLAGQTLPLLSLANDEMTSAHH